MILKYEEKMPDNCTETSNDYLDDWPNLCDFYVSYSCSVDIHPSNTYMRTYDYAPS